MADETGVPVTPTPGSEWWRKLYAPATLSAIAMLITAIGSLVSAMTAKALKEKAAKQKAAPAPGVPVSDEEYERLKEEAKTK